MKGRGFSRAETAPFENWGFSPRGLATTFVNIRLATAADFSAVMNLERSCPAAAHWSERRYRELFHPSGDAPERLALIAEALTAEDEPRSAANPASRASVVGFLVARPIASEWELENIAVAPSRRQGVGRQLLNALFDRARDAGGDSVFLEVRESNAAARSLYEKAGFTSTGRRKSYYAEPPEDAILYRKRLS